MNKHILDFALLTIFIIMVYVGVQANNMWRAVCGGIGVGLFIMPVSRVLLNYIK